MRHRLHVHAPAERRAHRLGPQHRPLWLAVASCLGVTLWLGIFPNQALQYALKGAQQLLR